MAKAPAAETVMPGARGTLVPPEAQAPDAGTFGLALRRPRR